MITIASTVRRTRFIVNTAREALVRCIGDSTTQVTTACIMPTTIALTMLMICWSGHVGVGLETSSRSSEGLLSKLHLRATDMVRPLVLMKKGKEV